MSAEKITITVDPEALEFVLRSSRIAAHGLIVEHEGDPLAVELGLAVDGLIEALEEARLAQ